MLLPNRSVAGQLLSRELMHLVKSHPLVLALPRGGVPVAAEVAKALDADLDILLIKRIISPLRPEVAIGAVAETGERLWQKDSLSYLGIDAAEAERLAAQKAEEIREQAAIWRPGRTAPDVRNRTVVLVDDGLATGSTMLAAIKSVRQQSPERIVVAVPVAPPSTVERIRREVDGVTVLYKPDTFYAVGQWYEDFGEVGDEEVKALLEGLSIEGPAEESVSISDGRARLPGMLFTVPRAKAIVLFAHGSGSTHLSPRNRYVARALNQAGFGTLLFDLLSESEAEDRRNVFAIDLLAQRLAAATRWLRARLGENCPPIGYFGASTGGAAAIVAAAKDDGIFSVVSRGGRPDLAGESLDRVKAPTLLIVGGSDPAILPLNAAAAKRLSRSEMVTIPGAGHLFENPGELEAVAEYAIDWFVKCSATTSAEKTVSPREAIADDLLRVAKPFRDPTDLEDWIGSIGRSRVVMLGEATHGTQEFYELRRKITERLIRGHGFRFVAVEGDWPDCYRLNRYVREGRGGSAAQALGNFRRWPRWLWNNEPAAALIEFLRSAGAGFYGLDLYSMYESVEAVREYASKLNPALRSRVEGVYSCFEPFSGSESAYAQTLAKGLEGCEDEVTSFLREIFRTRLAEAGLGAEELFDVRQNAATIRNAETYYRAMVFGGAESWNVRDHHMMSTLDSLLRHHGEGAKAIVWAHNTHIGDYHATDMLEDGYVNLGGLARERYGIENVHLVGFGTYEGEVLAGRAWGAESERMTVPRAIPGSYEAYLHETSRKLGAATLLLPDLGPARLPSLSFRRGHRAIGVVYQPEEGPHHRNYVPTDLARRYDSFLFVDRTTALKELPSESAERGRLPETWPSGL